MVDSAFDPRTTVVLEGSAGANDPHPVASLPPNLLPEGEGAVSAPGPRSLTPDPPHTPGAASITSYDSEEVAVRVTSERAAYLVLTDPFFPGWVARLDGQRASLLQADYLFRAVAVPAGAHMVTFTYEPVWIARGALLSLLAFAFVLAIAASHGLAVLRARLALVRRAERTPVPESPPSPAPGLS
jgi:hypothetical protein